MGAEDNLLEKHVDELIPGYALDLLSDEESLFVAQHLRQCGRCRDELAVYQALTDELALATPQVSPSAGLKGRLMDQVQAPPVSEPAAPPEPGLWQRVFAFFSSPLRAWSTVSAFLIAILAISNVLLWQQVNRAGQQTGTVLRVINMEGTELAPRATGLVVVSQDGEHGTLVVDHLPSLDPSQEYQLWLIRDGRRTDGGVFSVSSDGYGSLWVDSPQPLASYQSFGVTIEPAGGSPGPTGEKVLGGDL